MNKFIFLISLLLPALSYALNPEHAGSYAVVHKDGHVTDFVFYASTTNARWNVEQKNKDGSWSNVTCVTDCILKDSSAADISSFIPASVLQKQDFTCVHNSAFAFCFYTTKENRNQGGYVLIALTKNQPIPVFLKKLSNEKIRD